MTGGSSDYVWVLMDNMRHANTMFRIMSALPVAAMAMWLCVEATMECDNTLSNLP